MNPPTPPHQDKTMKFRQGTKWCCSSFLSDYYLPLSYLMKTKHWSLLHFKGLFSVNLFSRYSLCIVLSTFFVYFHFFSSIFCCSYFIVVESKTVTNRGTFSLACFLDFGTETANQIGRITFSIWAGFPHCCYVPASSLTSSAKLCVEASVNMFRCGNTSSLARKCT